MAPRAAGAAAATDQPEEHDYFEGDIRFRERPPDRSSSDGGVTAAAFDPINANLLDQRWPKGIVPFEIERADYGE